MFKTVSERTNFLFAVVRKTDLGKQGCYEGDEDAGGCDARQGFDEALRRSDGVAKQAFCGVELVPATPFLEQDFE